MPAAKKKAAKLYDVMLTRGVFIPDAEGQMEAVGPKKPGGKAVKVTVNRRLGNQIVTANRGYWVDGDPPGNIRAPEPAAEPAMQPGAAKAKG
jgi:hypothetical protein